MIYLLLYPACGVVLTAFVLWRTSMADPSTPLVEEGEWAEAVIAATVMVLVWPFWLYRMLEVGL